MVRLFAVIGLLYALTGCSSILQPDVNTNVSELEPGQYRIDPRHSALIFKVEHLGLSTFLGRFNTIDATLDFSPDDMANTRLDAVVQTGSVDVNDEKLEKMLKGGSWFN